MWSLLPTHCWTVILSHYLLVEMVDLRCITYP